MTDAWATLVSKMEALFLNCDPECEHCEGILFNNNAYLEEAETAFRAVEEEMDKPTPTGNDAREAWQTILNVLRDSNVIDGDLPFAIDTLDAYLSASLNENATPTPTALAEAVESFRWMVGTGHQSANLASKLVCAFDAEQTRLQNAGELGEAWKTFRQVLVNLRKISVEDHPRFPNVLRVNRALTEFDPIIDAHLSREAKRKELVGRVRNALTRRDEALKKNHADCWFPWTANCQKALDALLDHEGGSDAEKE